MAQVSNSDAATFWSTTPNDSRSSSETRLVYRLPTPWQAETLGLEQRINEELNAQLAVAQPTPRFANPLFAAFSQNLLVRAGFERWMAELIVTYVW